MTQQSTIARAATLDRPGIAWIGRFRVGDDTVDFVVSEDDLARDSRWAAGILSGFGISPGEHILVTARPSDSPWLDEFRVAARTLGIVHSNAEAWNWDARRAEMFIRRLNSAMVIGLSAETVAAMGQITDVAERLSSVRHVLARRDALAPLRELGVDAGSYALLGPAVAVSAPDGSGLSYDENEWAVEELDGELVVSSVGPRATTFDRQRTGARGQVTQSAQGARVSMA